MHFSSARWDSETLAQNLNKFNVSDTNNVNYYQSCKPLLTTPKVDIETHCSCDFLPNSGISCLFSLLPWKYLWIYLFSNLNRSNENLASTRGCRSHSLCLLLVYPRFTSCRRRGGWRAVRLHRKRTHRYRPFRLQFRGRPTTFPMTNQWLRFS